MCHDRVQETVLVVVMYVDNHVLMHQLLRRWYVSRTLQRTIRSRPNYQFDHVIKLPVRSTSVEVVVCRENTCFNVTNVEDVWVRYSLYWYQKTGCRCLDLFFLLPMEGNIHPNIILDNPAKTTWFSTNLI